MINDFIVNNFPLCFKNINETSDSFKTFLKRFTVIFSLRQLVLNRCVYVRFNIFSPKKYFIVFKEHKSRFAKSWDKSQMFYRSILPLGQLSSSGYIHFKIFNRQKYFIVFKNVKEVSDSFGTLFARFPV